MPETRSLSVAIIDYGRGNLASVAGAIERCGSIPQVTRDPETMRAADCLILPGVGAFREGMNGLRDIGLISPLNELVLKMRKPILGICLGAQLMTRISEEFGHTEGLNWVKAEVRRIDSANNTVRIPHVGWNDMERVGESELFAEIGTDVTFYFNHSFGIHADDEDIVIGRCAYGESFVAAFQQGNIIGTQFHPEKSQKQGVTLLSNFLAFASRVA